jgi:hypothetical protein
MTETRGCTCEQILAMKPGKDKGELKEGCTKATMEKFINEKGWAKPGKHVSTLSAMLDGTLDTIVVLGVFVALAIGFLVGKRK